MLMTVTHWRASRLRVVKVHVDKGAGKRTRKFCMHKGQSLYGESERFNTQLRAH